MAQALFTIAHLLHLTRLRLTLAHLNSPNIADKAALLTFPNRNRFRAGDYSGQTTSCTLSIRILSFENLLEAYISEIV